jgi:hypothetical protein
MSWTGDTQIEVLDGGGATVSVPSNAVQVVMGCAAGGVDFEINSTTSPALLGQLYTAGPLPECGALTCNAKGVVLAMKMPSTTDGSVRGADASPLTVSSATNANPIVVTTSAPHGLITGSLVTIAAVGGNTNANGTFRVTKLSSTTFSIPKAGNSAYTSGGTVQPLGAWSSSTGTAAITPDGTSTPQDDYYCRVKVAKGGTVGVTGMLIAISLDRGRTYGPNISIGTANTYAIPGTGLVLALSAGALVTGDYFQFSTIAPAWGTSDLTNAMQAWLDSPYSSVGWGGGMHLVGVSDATVAAMFQSGSPGLEQLAGAFTFSRGMMSARDASPPVEWGGTGETEPAWLAAINADFATVDAKRVLCGGGHYNMPSAFPSAVAGQPLFRRPIAWAQAAREVQGPPQRHSGRVRDGALATIVQSASLDPKDGFIYHDESRVPSLDNFLPGGVGRFCAARTRPGRPGWFVTNPRLLAAPGSQFTFWPRGAVMDVACTICHQTGDVFINDNIRTLPAAKGGVIDERDARMIERLIGGELRDKMTSTGMISGATVSVDRTNNVQEDDEVNIAVELQGDGYILQENITVAFATAASA